MVIRKATADDFPEVLKMINEFASFQRTPEKVTISLEQMLQDQAVFNCLIAETPTKEIIGFATYFYTYFSWSGKGLYLDDLYVKNEYRNQLVGTRFLKALAKLAADEHCKKMRWQVSKWNEPAIEFYKKMGAVIDETEINCDLYL
ncbi:MAG: GNAT family N-acetyltransferase [Bacteroidota bacterium]